MQHGRHRHVDVHLGLSVQADAVHGRVALGEVGRVVHLRIGERAVRLVRLALAVGWQARVAARVPREVLSAAFLQVLYTHTHKQAKSNQFEKIN